MRIELWLIGNTEPLYLEGQNVFHQRLKHYNPFGIKVFGNKLKAKGTTQNIIETESDLLLSKLEKKDLVVLLDDKGKTYHSEGFAKQLDQWRMSGKQRLVFIIGGAYGFSEKLYQRADAKLSLSKMTFSHQVVRVIFLEQLYRAFTILQNEPYHHG